MTEAYCIVCEKEAHHVCGQCKTMPYCSAECQALDWTVDGHIDECTDHEFVSELIGGGFRLFSSKPKTGYAQLSQADALRQERKATSFLRPFKKMRLKKKEERLRGRGAMNVNSTKGAFRSKWDSLKRRPTGSDL